MYFPTFTDEGQFQKQVNVPRTYNDMPAENSSFLRFWKMSVSGSSVENDGARNSLIQFGVQFVDLKEFLQSANHYCSERFRKGYVKPFYLAYDASSGLFGIPKTAVQ